MSLGVPVLQTRPDDADWTVELMTGTPDTAMAFARRELHPHPAAKRILVSTFLLNNSVLPADQIVRDQLAYKFGITQEKAFMTRDGQRRDRRRARPSLQPTRRAGSDRRHRQIDEAIGFSRRRNGLTWNLTLTDLRRSFPVWLLTRANHCGRSARLSRDPSRNSHAQSGFAIP